ncbi:small serum protein 5-like [Hemicordylus capensis]|uniref:small serum protein 5-like n=1 Tax=Hemicordylus capensis TaxID=884348 RepID=UPI0023020870|nr:small serum protein 5-like [Hemicordylus capensis]
MKVLLNLTVLCITWALCHGFCFYSSLRAEFKNGKFVAATECTDPYDKTKHPFGSTWNTEHCMKCDCSTDNISCCSRYGGIVNVQGCNTVRDPDTCTYKFFDSNNPEKPCWYTGKELHMS